MRYDFLYRKITLPKADALSDFSVALLLTGQLVNSALVALTGISGGILAATYVLCFFISVCCIPIHRRMDESSVIDLQLVYVILFCLFSFAKYGSYIRGGIARILFYIIVPYFMMSQRHDTIRVLKAMVVLSLFALPFVDKVLSFATEGLYMEMGAAYSVVPSIVASIIILLLYRRDIGLTIALGMAANLYYLLQVFWYGSRGAVICVLVAAVLLILRFRISGEPRLISASLLAIVFCVVFAVLMLNIDSILVAANDVALRKGYQVAFLEKSVRLLHGNDIDNGRSYIYSIAIEGSVRKPFFGNGVNMFEHNTGISYPHNFVLQLLYDGGLVLTAIVLLPLVLRVYRIYAHGRRDAYAMFVLLFAISIPRLMFSQDLWEVVYFWALIAYLHLCSSKDLEYVNRLEGV